MKGMPHPRGPFLYHDEVVQRDFFQSSEDYQRAKAWLAAPFSVPMPTTLIGKRIYFCGPLYAPLLAAASGDNDETVDGQRQIEAQHHSQQSRTYFAKHVTFDMIQASMNRNYEVICLFGTIHHRVHNQVTGQLFGCTPEIISRMLLREDYWKREGGVRRFMSDDEWRNVQALSVPQGYCMLEGARRRQALDYEQDALFREQELAQLPLPLLPLRRPLDL